MIYNSDSIKYTKGRVSAGGLVGEIEEAVERARKHAEWEIEYMTWQAFEMDARREGRRKVFGRDERRAFSRDE